MIVWFSLIPAFISVLCIASIANSDPKRLRNLRGLARERVEHTPQTRRRLTVIAMLPGALLILFAQWSALLLWLGIVLTSGWLISLLLAARDHASS